ncbi:variable surface lipoprotein [Mycoplasmopsis bovis]|uniref:variable surface lipoprotein n=1 Tax=Mycoplasmopsis bovis TaxID=28903 RepID=UPI003F79DC5F
MKKINKIFITLASIVSISSLPIVAASCDVIEKTEEGTGANSGTKDQEDQTSPKDQEDQTPQKGQEDQTPQKNKSNQTPQKNKSNQTSPKDQEDQTPPKDQEDQTPQKGQEDQTPQKNKSNQTPQKNKSNQTSPKDQEDQTPPKDQEDQTPQKGQEDQTPQKNKSNQTPQKNKSNQTSPKDQEDQTPPKDQKDKKYRLPELKEFLDKNDGKLFEVDRKKAKEELEGLASEGALRIDNGKIKHHKDKGRGKSKKRRSRNSYKDVEHLMLDSKFGESNKVNTHSKNKENIGYNLGGNKKGIKISKEDNKIVLEWQLYFEDGTKDDKIYRQEINLN